MPSFTALSQSMHHITASKLSDLAEQRDGFEAVKNEILNAVSREPDQSETVRILLNAFREHEIPDGPAGLSTKNVRRFLDQCQHDSSVPPSLLEEWQNKLKRALDIQSRKYEYASLFGRLVTEWLENPNDAAAARGVPQNGMDIDSGDSFEQVGRAEMHKQRQAWESLVFKESRTNPNTITAYLTELFSSTSKAKKLTKTPLENLREQMKSFKIAQMTKEDLEQTMNGLVKTDLLSEQSRRALSEFQSNKRVSAEILDVLNLQLDRLDSWSWGTEAIPLEMRRTLNGKYRVYMDEEILQALFLQYIGVSWAVHLRTVFTAFFHSGAWKQSSHHTLDQRARQRRDEFLGPNNIAASVRNARRSEYIKHHFLTQLPMGWTDGRDYGDLEEGEPDDFKTPVAIKQSLLHLVSTETLLNTHVYGSFTILQSDFKWFGPSLPHSTIFAVLDFFGIHDRWLKFFRKFLEAPVKFTHDGSSAQVQVRKCGIPITHALSTSMGEAVLFVLDFAVNQSTNSNLYRFHDDLWFWGQQTTTVKAWKAIKRFAEVTGLSMNEEKTGSIQINKVSTDIPPPEANLPKGQIRWGFLIMEQSGKWTIDIEQIDQHIEELRLQLLACKSLMSYIQAWNMYVAKFFVVNFGKPAQCLGRRHIDMAIEGFTRIQRGLFATGKATDKSVTETLKTKLAERFNVTSVPDGFLFFPTELGGLDLQNPLIPLLLVRESADKDPRERLERASEAEEDLYEESKKAYENGQVRSQYPSKPQPFMSLDEYTRYREETSIPLLRAYTELLKVPKVQDVDSTPDVMSALSNLPRTNEKICRDWASMNPYHKWVTQLYAADIIRDFGSMSMGEKKLLPIGLASMLRDEKIRWQG